MVHLEFTKEEEEELSNERYFHSHPRVRQKCEVLWLKSQGIAHKKICILTRISSTTLTSYLKEYKSGGISALKSLRFYQPHSDLEKHRDLIVSYFQEHPPASTKEAKAKIYELTGISRSLTRTRHFLHRCGLSPRKIGMIPAKADVEKQREFKKKSLNLG